MTGIIPLLGTLGTSSVLILLYILARLSERFGAVIKMPPLYRYYYVAALLIAIGLSAQLLAASIDLIAAVPSAWVDEPVVLFWAYYLPLSIGLTISLVVTWRYWRWLIIERSE